MEAKPSRLTRNQAVSAVSFMVSLYGIIKANDVNGQLTLGAEAIKQIRDIFEKADAD